MSTLHAPLAYAASSVAPGAILLPLRPRWFDAIVGVPVPLAIAIRGDELVLPARLPASPRRIRGGDVTHVELWASGTHTTVSIHARGRRHDVHSAHFEDERSLGAVCDWIERHTAVGLPG
jgi:hypothetical protein